MEIILIELMGTLLMSHGVHNKFFAEIKCDFESKIDSEESTGSNDNPMDID